MSEALSRYYFVCSCGAKLFALAALADCPRCGCQLVSSELLPIPWRKKGEPSASELDQQRQVRGPRASGPQRPSLDGRGVEFSGAEVL
jgi:hypothetical protein